MELLLIIPVLLFSIIAHEVAHGFTAYLCGDPTAKQQGRLTMNPVAHIDLFGTIIFPGILLLTQSPILLGWAKPVPVTVGLLRNPHRHQLYVSLSGIAANLLLAVLGTVIYSVLLLILKPDNANNAWLLLAKAGIEINVILAVFNLMPIPPLDGSWVLYLILPRALAQAYKQLFPYGFLILVLLLMTNVLNYIMLPMKLGIYRLLSQIVKSIVQ